jgi:DinB superfamily
VKEDLMSTTKPGPVISAPYAEALGDQDPIIVMATTPDRLRKAVRGLTEAQLAKRPLPGKWSIKEIVAHLADGEMILGSRYRFVAAHERPVIIGYDQDAFVVMLGVGNTTTADLLDDFALARAVNLGLLDRLPAESFDRIGIHSERGEESILKMLHMVAGHDVHHLRQIETIRVGLFGAPKRRKAAPKKPKAAARKPVKKTARKTAKKAAKAVRPAKKAGKKPGKR